MMGVPRFTGFVRTFVFICAGVFVLELFARFGYSDGPRLFEDIVRFFGIVPEAFFRGMVYQAVTWVFFHGNQWHLLFNMLGFWMFGSLLQDYWGDAKFFWFVFWSAVLTGVVVATVGLFDPAIAHLPTIGASGIVFAILMAVSRLFPDQVVLFLFVFPMRLRYFAYLLIGMEFIALWSSNQNGVSNVAHLSGAAVGWLYISLMKSGRGSRGSSSGGGLSTWIRQVRERWRQRRMRKKLRIIRGSQEEGRQRWN